MRTILAAIACIGFGLIAPYVAAAPSYSITDLGVAGESAAGVVINNFGRIAITLLHQNNAPTNKVLFLDSEPLIELQTLGGLIHGIADINDNGQMVGISSTPDARYHAVLYADAQLQDWGALGELGSVASGINESGTIVGDIRNIQTSQAVIFNGPNDVTHLGTLGGSVSTASDINDLGQITGISLTSPEYLPPPTDRPGQEAFLYENGRMIGIGSLGGNTSNGYGINDLGQIVGDSSLANGEMHAFVWDKASGMRDLGTPGLQSIATHINNQGIIVGEVEVTLGNHRAAIFELADGYQLLQDLIPANSGWERLNRATDINELGQIVGIGVFNGQNRAFLMTPIPEPSTFVLLALVSSIAMVRFRRR